MKKLGKRILSCVLTLALAAAPMALPFSSGVQRVEAASKKPSKRKVKGIYKKLLEKRRYRERNRALDNINYFYLLDINRDGVSELICFDKYGDNSLYIFTVKKGKLFFLGTSGSHISYNEIPKLYYSKKYKALCRIEKSATFGGGCVGPSYEYYRIAGAEMKPWRYTAKMGVSPPQYTYYKIGSDGIDRWVSKKQQKAFYKRYFASKYIKEYILFENTPQNRIKLLGK